MKYQLGTLLAVGLALPIHQQPDQPHHAKWWRVDPVRLDGVELLNYWVNPFPSASFGINHFFSYIAQAMVASFDQHSLDQLLQLLKNARDGISQLRFRQHHRPCLLIAVLKLIQPPVKAA